MQGIIKATVAPAIVPPRELNLSRESSNNKQHTTNTPIKAVR
jgi:hypothetical protein